MKKIFVCIIAALALFSCNKDDDDQEVLMESLLYPDGMIGEAVMFNSDTVFTVPEGLTFYIHNCYLLLDSTRTRQYYFPNWDNNDVGTVQISMIPQGTTLTSEGFLNGLLVESGVEVFSWYSNEEYVVPDGKTLYLTSFNSTFLLVDGEYIASTSTQASKRLIAPLMIPSGAVLKCWRSFIFTGYFRNQ